MMLPPAPRVFLACGFTDMRKGFDGLAALVRETMQPEHASLWLLSPVSRSRDAEEVQV